MPGTVSTKRSDSVLCRLSALGAAWDVEIAPLVCESAAALDACGTGSAVRDS